MGHAWARSDRKGRDQGQAGRVRTGWVRAYQAQSDLAREAREACRHTASRWAWISVTGDESAAMWLGGIARAQLRLDGVTGARVLWVDQFEEEKRKGSQRTSVDRPTATINYKCDFMSDATKWAVDWDSITSANLHEGSGASAVASTRRESVVVADANGEEGN